MVLFPPLKKNPKINKESHNIINTVCAGPLLAPEAEIIVFNSKYIDVFQTNKDNIKNNTNSTELKKEIQN
jgi:hypothetical protein